ncbi:MAG: hypothetical protein WAV41_02215 [Microgenomates group bacterium]
MKSFFRGLSIVILLAALLGGAYLVQKNQNLKRGAAAAETSSSILPSNMLTTVGKEFEVHVWADTGRSDDKLVGAEFWVGYDYKNLEFVGATPQNGYSILNDDLSGEGNGAKMFRMVTLDEEKAGAVELVKLTFRPLNSESGEIKVGWGTLMINGQKATWDIAKHNTSYYKSGNSPTPTMGPPVGGGRCGSRCGNSAMGCGAGMTCTPIWWTCESKLPVEMLKKLETNQAIDRTTINEMVRICPKVAEILPKKYDGKSPIKLPTFYGVCRNASCTGSVNCVCGPTATPTVVAPTRRLLGTPTVSKAKPTMWKIDDGQ